jgi:hypothetical protein
MAHASARILLKAGPTPTKFLNLLVGRDGSVYVHMYRPIGAPWMAPPPTLIDIPAGQSRPIEFDRFTPSSFNHNKVTFHPSGFIHLTDTAGKRLRDGVRGPAFKDMVLPYDLAAFVPCEPSRLPPVTSGHYVDLIFELPEPVTPLRVTISLVDPSAPPPNAEQSIYGKPEVLQFPHFHLLLAVALWTVQSLDPTPVPWPPFPFHFLRT